MTTFVVAGSFNPFHNGHLYLIQEALRMLQGTGQVVVIQAQNPDKSSPQDAEKVV